MRMRFLQDQLSGVEASGEAKSNARCLCYTAAVAEFCAALSLPVTNKWTMSCPEVTSQLISLSEVVWGLTIVLVCKMWYKGSPVRRVVWRLREWLNIGELITTIGCVAWMFISPNPYLLYIVNAVIFWCIFCSWFDRILDFVKAKLFAEPELRNSFDTMSAMYGNIASTGGFIIGACVSDGIPLRLAFVFWLTGVSARTLGRAWVMRRNRATLAATADDAHLDEAEETTDDNVNDELLSLRAENERLREEIRQLKANKAWEQEPPA